MLTKRKQGKREKTPKKQHEIDQTDRHAAHTHTHTHREREEFKTKTATTTANKQEEKKKEDKRALPIVSTNQHLLRLSLVLQSLSCLTVAQGEVKLGGLYVVNEIKRKRRTP